MTPDSYLAQTPFGTVVVDFPEDGGSIMEGNAAALEHLRGVMSAATNGVGASMTPGNLEPRDLVYFCQPPGSGVKIIPPVDFEDADGEGAPVLDSVESPGLAKLREGAAALAAAREGSGKG